MTTPAATPTPTPVQPTKMTILHFTDIAKNSNKWYALFCYADRFVTAFGGMKDANSGAVISKILEGQKPQGATINETVYTTPAAIEAEYNATLKAKLKKGYTEVTLATTNEVAAMKTSSAIVPAVNAKVKALIDTLAAAAQVKIDEFISAQALAALSKTQIDAARSIIAANTNLIAKYATQIDGQPVSVNMGAINTGDILALQGAVNNYYRAVPTNYKRRNHHTTTYEQYTANMIEDWMKLVASGEAENRLNLLEGALTNFEVTGTAAPQYYGGLQTNLTWVAPGSDTYNDIVANIKQTERGMTIRDVFVVEIPNERARYNASKLGKTSIKNMFHCTDVANGIHILKTGYKIPTGKTNGWRFGRGVYNAVDASRAYMYKGRANGKQPYVMFVNEVAAGREWCNSGGHLKADEAMTQPKAGYDCTRGTNSNGGRDEWIIYNLEQITIRAIVLFD